MTQSGAPTFRDESDAISASWWNGENGKKVRYCMSILWDGNAQGAIYAVKARYPHCAPPDAFPWIGQDRGISRGFQESLGSYIERCVQWLDRAPYYGHAAGVMLAVRGWILPQMPLMRVVTNSQRWYEYADGLDPMPPGADSLIPPTFNKAPTTPWDWDGLSSNWWRSWLIIYSTTTPWCSGGELWGGGLTGFTWGSFTWGFSEPASTFNGIVQAVAQWKSRHCWYPEIIVSFENDIYGPNTTVNPNGTWARWSKIVNRTYVTSRPVNSRFLGGVA